MSHSFIEIQSATFPIFHRYWEDDIKYFGSCGTAYFINRSGYFLTCSHVMAHIGERSEFMSYGNLMNPKSCYQIEEIYNDSTNDFFLGRILNSGKTPFVKLAFEIGKQEKVFYLGYGDAGPLIEYPEISLENIKQKCIQTFVIDKDKNNKTTNVDRFFTIAGVPAGMSGGPVINENAMVIGMCTSVREIKDGKYVFGVFTAMYAVEEIIAKYI